jgi:hypothetical protein
MRRIEAKLAQQALEEQNAAAKQVFVTNKGDDTGQTTGDPLSQAAHDGDIGKSRVTRHKPPIPPRNSFLRSRAAPGLRNPPSTRSSTQKIS